jgi:hypothetical protein
VGSFVVTIDETAHHARWYEQDHGIGNREQGSVARPCTKLSPGAEIAERIAHGCRSALFLEPRSRASWRSSRRIALHGLIRASLDILGLPQASGNKGVRGATRI